MAKITKMIENINTQFDFKLINVWETHINCFFVDKTIISLMKNRR